MSAIFNRKKKTKADEKAELQTAVFVLELFVVVVVGPASLARSPKCDGAGPKKMREKKQTKETRSPENQKGIRRNESTRKETNEGATPKKKSTSAPS